MTLAGMLGIEPRSTVLETAILTVVLHPLMYLSHFITFFFVNKQNVVKLNTMKILMLGWELPPHNSGGLGVACLNMARALVQNGAKIDFVVPYSADHPGTSFMNIVAATQLDPITRYGGAYESEKITEQIIPTLNKTQYVSIRDIQHMYCEFIDEYLKKNYPDIVHAHDWLTFEAGIIAKKQHDLPLVAHVHATEFDRAGAHSGNPIIHEVEQEGLMMADKIIAVSEATKRLRQRCLLESGVHVQRTLRHPGRPAQAPEECHPSGCTGRGQDLRRKAVGVVHDGRAGRIPHPICPVPSELRL